MSGEIMTKMSWRRTSFRRLDGSIEVAADDWTLCDEAGRPLARIYRYLYGPGFLPRVEAPQQKREPR